MGKVLCGECRKVIESKSRHDFVSCGCSNETFIDGGDEYTRIGGANLSKIYVWNEEKRKFVNCTTDEEIGLE